MFIEKPIEFKKDKINIFKSLDINLNNIKKTNPYKLSKNQTFFEWLEKINL